MNRVTKSLLRVVQSFIKDVIVFAVLYTPVIFLIHYYSLINNIDFSHIIFLVSVLIISPLSDYVSDKININDYLPWSSKQKYHYDEKDVDPNYLNNKVKCEKGDYS